MDFILKMDKIKLKQELFLIKRGSNTKLKIETDCVSLVKIGCCDKRQPTMLT